jgi:hypothetical protein
MKPFKYFSIVSILGLSVLVLTPSISLAQSSQYNPTVSTGNGKSFSGVKFSGVGGAIAGCANVGGNIAGGVSGLFKKESGDGGSIGGQSVPTGDADAQKKLAKANTELKSANRTTNCLNGIAGAVAKSLLQQVSNKTLNWINTGLGGNPFYVQDINSNLKTIRDEKLGSYLNTVQNSNPIFGNAIRSAVTKQVTGVSDGYINKTMNTPEGRQYEAFQKDFTQGGWGAMLNMNNNPIGAFFNSTDKISKSIGTEQKNRVDEIQRNFGFLDMKECIEYKPVQFGSSSKDICKDDGIPLDERPPGTPCVGGTTPSPLSAPKKLECLTYKTTTPGSLISEQAKGVLGTSVRQLELADSINEVLGSFFDQLLNGLFQKGLGGLQNKKTAGGVYGASGFGNNIILGSNGLPITGGNSGGLGYQTGGSGYDVQDFDISRPQQMRAIVQAQYDFISRSKDSKIVIASIVPTLGALDYCIPGPNPTWNEGLGNNFQSFVGSLETPTAERTFLGKLLSAATSSTVQAIVGLFGGGGNEKALEYILIGQPGLYDKVSDGQRNISVWSYEHWTGGYGRPIRKSTSADRIKGFIGDGYNNVIAKYQSYFTLKNTVDLFKASAPGNLDVEPKIKNAFKETVLLATYNRNLSPLDAQYQESITEAEDSVVELENIRTEAQNIVRTAKARYIAERATAGNPVVMSCIDSAYVVKPIPDYITPVAQIESNTPDPKIKTSKDASNYFYSSL